MSHSQARLAPPVGRVHKRVCYFNLVYTFNKHSRPAAALTAAVGPRGSRDQVIQDLSVSFVAGGQRSPKRTHHQTLGSIDVAETPKTTAFLFPQTP